MPPEARKLLTGIHEAAGSVHEFVQGKTLADMKSDKLLRSGIYYQFTIIG